jgi:hypothetical protein
MSGFPTRPSRTAFGPTKLNTTAGLLHPAYHTGSTETNLSYWQLAGCGVVTHRAWALLAWNGAVLSLSASAEAWDANGSAVPTVARTGAGVYTVTYAATYNDETGTAASTALLAAAAHPQGSASRHATCAISSGRIITVYAFDAAGSAADVDSVLVLAW